MQRAKIISTPFIKGVKTHLRSKNWEAEKSYTTIRGNEICTPAPYEKPSKSNRKFKILTIDLTNLRYVG